MNTTTRVHSCESQSSEKNEVQSIQEIEETHPIHNLEKVTSSVQKCRNGLFAQSLATFTICVAVVGAGMPIGFSAVLLPQLQSPNETLQIDEELGSWIASIHSAATPIGSILSGELMDYFGRKLALQFAGVPLIFGWILICVSQNHVLLLLGRISAGLSTGLLGPVAQVYIAEMCDPEMRGVFSSVPFSSYSFGILLVYILGSLFNWRVVSGLCIILPSLAIIMFSFLPESPVWLVSQGKIEEARKACLWFKGGNTIQTKLEIQEIINRAENEKRDDQNFKSKLQYFLTPQVLKPFFILTIFIILQTLAGIYLVVFYAVDIISTIGSSKINEFFVAILTAGFRFVFAVVSSILLSVTGRRVVGLSSAVLTGVAAFSLAMLLHIKCPNDDIFVAICLLWYVAANTIGVMVLPGVLAGELYPVKVRGFAGSLTFGMCNILVFGVTKLFPYLKTLMSVDVFFLIFGISSFVLALFIYLFLPETKSKTLNEIEDYFLEHNLLCITRKDKTPDLSE